MAGQHDHRLERALSDLTAALSATGAPWMIIGGIAVIARGVRRFTTDIDAAIRGDRIELPALLKALAKKRIMPRVKDAKELARASLVLLLRHETTGVDFDVSFAWTSFEHEAIDASTVAAFGTVEAPMARPEDLIVFKSIAARGRDIDDMIALLTLYPDIDLVRVRERVRSLATAAEAPDLTVGLETAITTAAQVRPTKRKSARAVRPRAAPRRKPRANRKAAPRNPKKR